MGPNIRLTQRTKCRLVLLQREELVLLKVSSLQQSDDPIRQVPVGLKLQEV